MEEVEKNVQFWPPVVRIGRIGKVFTFEVLEKHSKNPDIRMRIGYNVMTKMDEVGQNWTKVDEVG